MKKKNTFADFIACAEHLIAHKYTSSARLAIEGRSAGGLLIGAVLNMRPDLFQSAIMGVRVQLLHVQNGNDENLQCAASLLLWGMGC